MKIFAGIILGLLSAFLIYMMLALLIVDPSQHQTVKPFFVISVFLAGWAFSSVLLIKGAQATSNVVMRGFLLGAAEWLLMIFVGIVFSGKTAMYSSSINSDSSATSTGAMIGGGIASILFGGFSFFMVLVCLAGFAIVYFMKREMKTENSSDEEEEGASLASLNKEVLGDNKAPGGTLIYPPGGLEDKLAKLKAALDVGIITLEEYRTKREKLLEEF